MKMVGCVGVYLSVFGLRVLFLSINAVDEISYEKSISLFENVKHIYIYIYLNIIKIKEHKNRKSYHTLKKGS